MAAQAVPFSKNTILPSIKRDNSSFEIDNAANQVSLDDFSYSSKLTNVESQRIMAVLQEIQKKVYLMGLIPEIMDKKTSTVLTGDALALIKEASMLEQKYKQIIEQRPYEGQSNDIKETTKAIKVLTRTICRYFLQNQNNMLKLRYLKSNKSPIIAQFEHRLQEIKTLVYDRLRTTVEEENQKQDQLSLIIAKEQKTSSEVKALREELEKAKKERSGEINKRNDIIRRLKEELRDIKQQAEETTRKLESKSKQKEDLDIKASKEKEAALLLEIETLKNQLEADVINHREEEALARKKKFKIECEVENWIHKYDQDLEEKQLEIDDITVLFLEEKSHLDELQGQYAELQKEYEIIQENKRKLEEKKREEENIKAKLNAAATLIQKIWRGYYVRREIQRKKDIIQAHHQNSIKEISEFLYNANELRSHLPLLETAIVLTGYNRSDHDSFYSKLMENPDFLFAKLTHLTSLKDIVKSINQQISNNLELESSDYDFQKVLEIQQKTGKHIIVIIPNFEEFNLNLLEKLVQLLIQSQKIKLLIGTFTLDQINSLSPRALNSLVTKAFQIENSKEILNEITRVIMDLDFKLGYNPFKAILDNFNLSFLSIEMFRNSIKYCLMSYCFGNPLLGLMELDYDSFEKDSFQLVRMLPSFKSFINNEIKTISEEEDSKPQIKQLLTDDKFLFDWVKVRVKELHEYTRDFNSALLVFEKMQSLFSTNSLKRPIRILYLDALKSNLGDTDYCKSCLLLFRKLQLPVIKQFLLDCSLIVHDKSGFLEIINEIPDVEMIDVEQEDEKYIIKEGLKRVRQELSSTRKRSQLDLSFSLFENEDEQILSKIITFLSNYFTANLKNYSSIVMNELLFFDGNVNKAVKAEPRAVVQTALKYPQMYIDTIVDTNILYKLYLECGRLINLQDWFEAFKVLCKHENME
ncbi:hypothetical protein HK103_004136 [Boothiomyces macroporosus]|uniref:Dynein regulatory complex protein 10 n=1 Tax=Boothiomyces macroporosus TaxID=261099 RepID=A0AAD5ULH7_9FUNG|nr:hypothetical protein HK103_004136 [Boothiomyces macroporosus]